MDTKHEKIVLVTCCHTRVGYNVVCGLVRAGWSVVAAGRIKPSMCSNLPGVIGDVSYPDPFENTDQFLEALSTAANEYGATVILPVHEDIFVVSRYKLRLKTTAHILVPRFEELLAVHDKGRVPYFAEKAGVPTPKTRLINCLDDLHAAIKEIGTPCLLKPRFGSGAQGIRVIKTDLDIESLSNITDQELQLYPSLLQEWVGGIGAGVNMLIKDGEIIAVSGHHRLREVPIKGGTGSAHVSLTHPGIIQAGMDFVKATPFTNGVIMIEFRYNRDADKFYVVEVNPRYWASITNALASGLNFPALHVDALVYGNIPSSLQKTSKVVESRFVMGEIKCAQELLFAGRWKEIGGFFKRHADEKLVFEDFGMGGFRAFYTQVTHALKSAREHGNFGFQTNFKDEFFLESYAEQKMAPELIE